MRSILFMLIICPSIIIASEEQDTFQTLYDSIPQGKPIMTIDRLEQVSLGFGLGLDMGGIGMNVVAYPQRNLGLFAGLGYAFVGAGVNAGIKIRMVGEKSYSRVIPYGIAMYGTNAVVIVKNASSFNRRFSGPTVGFGLDIKSWRRQQPMFKSFAILIPLRSHEAKNYPDSLGSRVVQDYTPFTISVGLRISLDNPR